jgi:hypothetical protein
MDIFKSDVKFLDFRYNSEKGSVGYSWFCLKYLYLPDDFRIEIEHDRLYLNIEIYDPHIVPNDRIWCNRNSVCNIMAEARGVHFKPTCTLEAIKTQVKYLYNILVNRNPQFYPIKYKVRAKTPEGQKYWIKYWEEHPLK